MKAFLVRAVTKNRAAITVATLIAFTVLFLVSFPVSRSFLSFTKVVAWDSMWLDPRLDRVELLKCLAHDGRSCPSYFAWIFEDLAPWNETGITPRMLQDAKSRADFRIVIVDGKLYHERYNKCFQTRDDYTLWGLLMLLETFPGMVPDVEMYFGCGDHPRVLRTGYRNKAPPPIFSYCTSTSDEHYDILFPDWSFWGWPEVNIRPWVEEQKAISNGATKNWFHRKPDAYWKGNVFVGAPIRRELLRCNSSEYNVVIYNQDWGKETQNGFLSSSLSRQCHSRYKIHVQGNGWSVSLKYIMACGSTVVHIEPQFWEFFARSWMPFVHYLPVSRENLCQSIKHAVAWGNAHPAEAAKIAECGSSFVKRQLTMEHVYSYKLHLMRAYAKLQRFKPAVPEGVKALTLDSTLRWHEVTIPTIKTRGASPCEMPSRDHASIAAIRALQRSAYERANRSYIS